MHAAISHLKNKENIIYCVIIKITYDYLQRNHKSARIH